MPGVVAVISHHNAPRLSYAAPGPDPPGVGERLHVLQDDHVRFFGQPVAVVVAETLDAAERAAAALVSGMRPNGPSSTVGPKAQAVVPEAGRDPGARFPADRREATRMARFRRAPVRIDATYGMAREKHNPMEPHATVAAWDGDRLTLWSKTQFVVNEPAEIAAMFGLPPRT